MTSVAALEGIKVIDLASMVAGPLAASILGDLGADVLKIEPLRGDEARGFGETRGDLSGVFVGVNRNKRSLAIDFRSPRGVEVIRTLCTLADVVIDNARQAARARSGLDAESLRLQAPRLIVACVSAFGTRGPLAERPGVDPVAQALSGLMAATGSDDSGPTKAGPPIADASAAYLTAVAILSALMAREKTGEGQIVDTSLLAALIHLQSPWVGQYLFTGFVQPRNGNSSVFYAPYDMFETADGGSVHVAAYNDRFYRKLCAAVGRPDLADDPRFASNDGRLEHREFLHAEIAAWFARQSTDTALEKLTANDVIHAPVLAYPDTFAHSQVLENDLCVKLDGEAELTVPGVPFGLSETPGTIRSGPPHLGEHGAEVLAEAGISAADVAQMERDGVIKQRIS